MKHLEYLEYFVDGPIKVSVEFGRERGWIADRSTTPEQIGRFIQWLQGHPEAPVFFDDHPYVVTRVEFIASRNALVLHAKEHTGVS